MLMKIAIFNLEKAKIKNLGIFENLNYQGPIHKKVENPKNMLFIKNPQFLSDFAQTFRD